MCKRFVSTGLEVFELKNSWGSEINRGVLKRAAVRSCGNCGTKTALTCHVVAK